MEEVWKIINVENFNKYEISTMGNVRRIKDHKSIKSRIAKNGYLIISLVDDFGKPKTFELHRLVALTFIPNLDNLPIVNHKDENKANPFVENLEWCTEKYNSNYGTIKEKQRNAKIGLYDGENNPMYGKKHSDYSKNKMSDNHYDCFGENNPMSIKVIYKGIIYNCIKDCAKKFNVNYISMTNYLNGKQKTIRNFDVESLEFYEKENE